MAIINRTSIFTAKKFIITQDSSIDALQITNIAPAGETSGSGVYWVSFGTFGGIIPDDLEASFSVIGSGIKYVYIEAVIDEVDDDIRVTQAQQKVFSSTQTNTLGDLPHTIYYLLGTIDDGAVSNTGGGSINVHIISDSKIVGSTLKRRYRYSFLR
jgi:hypothetical protein